MLTKEHTFTVAETAFVTEMSKADVNHEIDQEVVPGKAASGAPRARRGRGDLGTRMLDESEVLFLAAVKPVKRDLSVALRKRLCRAFGAAVRNQQEVAKVGPLLFCLKDARDRVAARAAQVERLHAVVEVKEGVAGGEAVVRGTRIKPWLVAEMLEAGTSAQEIMQEYDLTAEQVELAQLYARLYPRRGRPKKAEARRNLTEYALPPR